VYIVILTQATDYGMAAVIYLSQRNGHRNYSIDEISRTTEIPEEFLRKIFQVLVKSGIIRSFKLVVSRTFDQQIPGNKVRISRGGQDKTRSSSKID